jgi:F-type H+-transporting ATPase subunit a
MMLGAMVCFVQTLVFCILSTVYIGMAVEHHDHDHDEAAHH